jgi:hypothetical protein
MANVLIPRFGVPKRIPVGSDGIPNYIAATPGAPGYWRPPEGFELKVYHEGVMVFWIVEADRVRGWAKGFHWRVEDGQVKKVTHDDNGVTVHRLYEGRITFKLVRRG